MRIYRPKITKEYIIWIDLNFFHRWTFEVFTNFEDLAVLFFTFMIIFFPKSTFISTSPPPHVLSESSVGEIWFMIWRLLSLYRFRFRMSFICIYIRFRDLKKSSWSWIWYHSLSFLRQFMWEGGPIIIYLYRVSSLGYCLVLIYSWFPH